MHLGCTFSYHGDILTFTVGIMVELIDRQPKLFLVAKELDYSWSEIVERVQVIMYYQ